MKCGQTEWTSGYPIRMYVGESKMLHTRIALKITESLLYLGVIKFVIFFLSFLVLLFKHNIQKLCKKYPEFALV